MSVVCCDVSVVSLIIDEELCVVVSVGTVLGCVIVVSEFNGDSFSVCISETVVVSAFISDDTAIEVTVVLSVIELFMVLVVSEVPVIAEVSGTVVLSTEVVSAEVVIIAVEAVFSVVVSVDIIISLSLCPLLRSGTDDAKRHTPTPVITAAHNPETAYEVCFIFAALILRDSMISSPFFIILLDISS